MGAELAVTPDPAILSPRVSREDAAKRWGLLDLLRSESSVAEFNHGVGGEHSSRLAKGGAVPFAAPAQPSPDAFLLRRVRRCCDVVVVGRAPAKKHHATSDAQANFFEPIAVTRKPRARAGRKPAAPKRRAPA